MMERGVLKNEVSSMHFFGWQSTLTETETCTSLPKQEYFEMEGYFTHMITQDYQHDLCFYFGIVVWGKKEFERNRRKYLCLSRVSSIFFLFISPLTDSANWPWGVSKANFSSVSPSSKGIEELWVGCVLYKERWSYAFDRGTVTRNTNGKKTNNKSVDWEASVHAASNRKLIWKINFCFRVLQL